MVVRVKVVMERECQSLDRQDTESEYDRVGRSFHATDPDKCISTDIVLAVAEVSGRDPTELRPLNDVINADALDSLFTPERPGNETDQISFDYQGYRVTVYRDREILLQSRGGSDD